MWHCPKHYITLVNVFVGCNVIITAWLVAVVVRKLVGAATATLLTPSVDGLWTIVFLDNLSFHVVVCICMATAFMVSAGSALRKSLSAVSSAHTGRELRRLILKAAVTSVYETDISTKANELLVNVKVIEDFEAFDESDLEVHQVVVSLAVVLPFFFTWYGGLVAFGLLIFSELSSMFFEALREEHSSALEANRSEVNARLIDVIKNGTKIKVMGTAVSEQRELWEMEGASDQERSRDARCYFLRELFRISFICFIFPLMAIAAWFIIQNAKSTNDAINNGFGILLAILLLDEGHKSLIFLAFVNDRRKGATSALSAILKFLGPGQRPAMVKDYREIEDSGAMNSALRPNGWGLGRYFLRAKKMKSKCTNESLNEGFITRQEGSSILSLDKIVLTYPGRNSPVLSSYSQSFQQGRIHGLIGESGSGKSTVLKIIANLLEPDSGSMDVWGGDKVAYVSQDQKLFARSIRENVTYGATMPADDCLIWEALQQACLNDWVATLPDGLDTCLEGGEKMVSGGQLQRLHLAHLFFTCQEANIVILDEVLSAVDQVKRKLLIAQLQCFLQNKTAIIVTHHSEMLEICDEVHCISPAFLPKQDNSQTAEEGSSSSSDLERGLCHGLSDGPGAIEV